MAKSSQVSSENSPKKPLSSKTNEEVIAFLEDKGYEVEHLNGRRFQITRHYTEKDGITGEGFSATHVFNAATEKIEPRGSAKHKGNQMAETNRRKLENGKALLQSRFQRGQNSGITRHTRISVQRKEKEQ